MVFVGVLSSEGSVCAHGGVGRAEGVDELDQNLWAAWERVRGRLAGDASARGRRYERRLRAALRRPVGAWCVGLRASDRRIERSAFIEREAVWDRQRHRLMMFGGLVRELCKPVVIPWPGLIWEEAAGRLGVDPRTMIQWMDRGWVASRRERVPGRRGLPTRYVWTRGGGIDVCRPQGHDPVWGTLWQGLWRHIPDEFEQIIERVPRRRLARGPCREQPAGEGGVFRGWDWVCPGRMAADGRELGCGRVCKKLVAPLPAWTLDRAAGMEQVDRWVADATPRYSRFACLRCWNVQPAASDEAAAWNQFVSVISGGLLYGREVERARVG